MLRVRTLGISEIVVGDRPVGSDRPANFALLFLTALRAPRAVQRADLAALLWHDAPGCVRNHRMRSLLHRSRQAGALLESTDTAVRLAEPPSIDFREYSTPPRSLDDVRNRVSDIGPVLPGFAALAGTPLEARLDDERDAITGAVVQWIGAALSLARAKGDSALVEELARAGRSVDRFSEDAWASQVDSPTRVIHFAATPEHAREPGRLLIDLAGRLLTEPGAAGCDPAAYATLRAATARAALPNDSPGTGGRVGPEGLVDPFLELLAALTDEAPCAIVVDGAQVIAATAGRFWTDVLSWSSDRRLVWNFVSRPTRFPSTWP